MPIFPDCLVQDGAGPFVPTTNGVNLSLGSTVSVKLTNPTGVAQWFLEVIGTDELSSAPALTNVNPVSHEVLSPGATVTFTGPTLRGRALLFRSTVTDGFTPVSTTFAVYTLTDQGTRVAAAGETLEGNQTFGWSTVVNPLVRTGAPVVRYDDNLVTPAMGVGTVQGALDYLKNAVPIGPTVKAFDVTVPAFRQGGTVVRSYPFVLQNLEGACFRINRRCLFRYAYLGVTTNTSGPGSYLRLAVYQAPDGEFTKPLPLVQDVTTPIGGLGVGPYKFTFSGSGLLLVPGVYFLLHGAVLTSGGASIRSYANAASDLMNTNIPTGYFPQTFLTTFPVSSPAPLTVDPTGVNFSSVTTVGTAAVVLFGDA